MNDYLEALPTPLCVASMVVTVVAMVLLSCASHGKCREAWGNVLLLVAVVLLVAAFVVAGSAK